MPRDPKVPVDPILLSRARAMRGEPAPVEEKLWWHLRNRRLGGFKFRRQTPLQTFVADFFCFECKLVVELDGGSHGERSEEDRVRTRILERDGMRVIRFYNSDLNEHLDAVLAAILSACESNATPHAPSP
jgi:very-short-patch-repair endonuclease